MDLSAIRIRTTDSTRMQQFSVTTKSAYQRTIMSYHFLPDSVLSKADPGLSAHLFADFGHPVAPTHRAEEPTTLCVVVARDLGVEI